MAEAKQMMVGNQLVTFKDEAARNSIQEILQQLEEASQQIETALVEISNITISNNHQNEAINDIDQGLEGMKTNISKNANAIASLTAGLGTAQGLAETLNSEVARLKTSVASYDNRINAKIDQTQITSDPTVADETKVASAKVVNQLFEQMDGAGLAVIDHLESESVTSPLSANQGRILKGLVDANGQAIETNGANIATLQTAVSGLDGDVDTLKAKFSYGSTLPETLEEGKVFFLLKE